MFVVAPVMLMEKDNDRDDDNVDDDHGDSDGDGKDDDDDDDSDDDAEFGFEGEEILGSELQVKQNARLARALKRLAGELYGSDVHWQLELLQTLVSKFSNFPCADAVGLWAMDNHSVRNADDNSYQNGTLPTAEFLLRASEGGEVIFRCNETGFREAQCSRV
eukprot:s8351_g4.t1